MGPWVRVPRGAEASFRPYVVAQAFLQSHTRPHIHELVFSLCPYAASGVVLLLCCPQTGPFTAAPTRPKPPPTPPQPHRPDRASPLINYTHPSHTHNTIAPSVRRLLLLLGSSYGPCVTLGPLCLIRCYNQTTKGLTPSLFFVYCPSKRAAPLVCAQENAEPIRENNT